MMQSGSGIQIGAGGVILGDGGASGGGPRPQPPPVLALSLSGDGLTLFVSLTLVDFYGGYDPAACRVYFLSAQKVLNSEINTNPPPSQFIGRRELVVDTTIGGQETTVIPLPSLHYLLGGWMYVTRLDSTGRETAAFARYVPIPGHNLNSVAPAEVVTGMAASWGGASRITITLQWTAPATIVSMVYIHFHIGNFHNDGAIHYLNYVPVGIAGQPGRYTFVIDTEAADPVHNTYIYYQSASAAHTYIDYTITTLAAGVLMTAAPMLTIGGGIV